MKKYFYLLIMFAVICNCNEDSGNTTYTTNDEEVAEFFNTRSSDSIAIHAEVQKFGSAFFGGDPEVAVDLMYDGVWSYLQEQQPNVQNAAAKMRKMMISQIEEMSDNFKKNKQRIEIEVVNVHYAGEQDGRRLYLVNAFVNLVKEDIKQGDPMQSFPNDIIAISNNNGKDWKFVQYDPEISAPMLRKRFSDKIVYNVLQNITQKK